MPRIIALKIANLALDLHIPQRIVCIQNALYVFVDFGNRISFWHLISNNNKIVTKTKKLIYYNH